VTQLVIVPLSIVFAATGLAIPNKGKLAVHYVKQEEEELTWLGPNPFPDMFTQRLYLKLIITSKFISTEHSTIRSQPVLDFLCTILPSSI
jgi:hypothetical protein